MRVALQVVQRLFDSTWHERVASKLHLTRRIVTSWMISDALDGSIDSSQTIAASKQSACRADGVPN